MAVGSADDEGLGEAEGARPTLVDGAGDGRGIEIVHQAILDLDDERRGAGVEIFQRSGELARSSASTCNAC